MKKKNQIKYRYSGKNSKLFWSTINALPNEADRQELYSLGCILQNIEQFTLKALETAKKGIIEDCKQ